MGGVRVVGVGTVTEPSTEQLVVGAQSGDPAAREALFARYLPRVSRMVASRLGWPRQSLPVDAEDVAQEALVRALHAFDRFEMRSPGAFAAWMATIVLNCIRQHARRNGHGPTHAMWQRYGDLDLNESILAGSGGSPSSIVGQRENNLRIEAVLLTMPSLYREALTMRYLGHMSHAELAQHLGRTEVNVRKIVQRATEMLRSELGTRVFDTGSR
jgi:RNA polymerase sigma-70 factor (ECF subfamily)